MSKKKNKKSKSVAVQPKAKGVIWLKVLKYAGIVLGIIFVICLIIFGIYKFYDIITDEQSDDATEDIVAFFKVFQYGNHCYIDLVPKKNTAESYDVTHFTIDTGASTSVITVETLDLLREQGYEIEERFAPSVSYDAAGNYDIRTKVYQISFPIDGDTTFVHSSDSTYCLKSKPVKIAKVRFEIGKSNLLGADFLDKYCVEICHNRRYLVLHRNIPSGYNTKIDLKRFDWHLGDIGGRYLWVFPINGRSHKFLVDTGRGGFSIQLPYNDYMGDKPMIYIGTSSTSYSDEGKEIWGVKDTDSIVIGDHHIVSPVYYLEGKYKSPYSVNPLQLREKRGQLNVAFDILFDLGHDAMYFR